LSKEPRKNGSCTYRNFSFLRNLRNRNFFEFQLNDTELAKLAKRILAVPASSVAVERVFSQTGYILRPYRTKNTNGNAENLFLSNAAINFSIGY
jgi:hypothetical protein